MALKLVTVESVRTRIALPDRNLVTTAISNALEGATESLEAELRTSFSETTGFSELFYVDDSALFGSRFYEKLALSKGFVTEASNDVRVEVAPRKLNILQGDALDLRDTTNGTVTHKDQFVELSLNEGVVVVQDFRLISQYVRITYDFGFAPDSGDPSLFDQTMVPSQLKELATLWAMLELTANPVTGIDPNRRLEGDQQRPQHLRERINTLLDQLTRYEPEARVPIG